MIKYLNNYKSFLTDGPRGSLRRLRSQLAEDGCPESQVVLAKQLLEEQCGELCNILSMDIFFHFTIHRQIHYLYITYEIYFKSSILIRRRMQN